MARFPKIDSPCPLGQDELARIDGHCSRCSRTVHALDAMDDAGRAAFMRQAKGPICVSYRLPIGISAALALSMAAPAFAHDATPSAPSTRSVAAAPAHAHPAVPLADPAPAKPKPKLLEPMIVTGGGVRLPAAAQWTEDVSIPELPTAVDDAAAK